MMPTDRLTIRSTIFDSSANENIAAAVMLKTPAMIVASKMEVSIGSMLKPLVPGILSDFAGFCRILALFTVSAAAAERRGGASPAFYAFRSAHAMLLEPGQSARKAIPGVSGNITGAVIGMKRVTGLRVDDELRLAVA
jgi:hypothetical protein